MKVNITTFISTASSGIRTNNDYASSRSKAGVNRNVRSTRSKLDNFGLNSYLRIRMEIIPRDLFVLQNFDLEAKNTVRSKIKVYSS